MVPSRRLGGMCGCSTEWRCPAWSWGPGRGRERGRCWSSGTASRTGRRTMFPPFKACWICLPGEVHQPRPPPCRVPWFMMRAAMAHRAAGSSGGRNSSTGAASRRTCCRWRARARPPARRPAACWAASAWARAPRSGRRCCARAWSAASCCSPAPLAGSFARGGAPSSWRTRRRRGGRIPPGASCCWGPRAPTCRPRRSCGPSARLR
mmetsp:Transcript_115847/g.338805  ORF Transcript_115847/g.338805 Transcript_115847/m.338805 type:complete len:207 (+) Transcript_115847:91-711(+)